MNRIILIILFGLSLTSCNSEQIKSDKMQEAKFVEITTFRLNTDTENESFLKAAEQMENKFLKKQNGYISRVISQNENGEWSDIVFWKDKESHQSALANSEKSEDALPFMQAINFESVEMKLNQIK